MQSKAVGVHRFPGGSGGAGALPGCSLLAYGFEQLLSLSLRMYMVVDNPNKKT